MRNRRSLLIGAAVLAGTYCGLAQADAYPSKPIRWVVAYAAGGGSDALARAVGTQLSAQLGQSVLIDNKPGGATVIGAENVAKSPGDGYTVFTADNGTLVFNTALFKKLSYDPQKDFTAVGMMARFPLLLAVNPNAGYADVKALLEAAKANPGKLSFGSPGVGSPHHLAMEMLKSRAKLDMVHIAYRGAAPAIQDVVGGQLPLMVVDSAAGMQMIKAGKLKPLATFSKSRLAALPDVPSLMELGYTDVEAVAWQGLVVPSATPKDIVAKLSTELQKAIQSEPVRTQFAAMGIEPTPSDAAAMQKHWAQESQYWPRLIRERGISLD
ncbi:MAG: tripartite tricarboxylate transporter substrate binding protein [Acidovorax sp.]|uniref:Bug family tripartite tricarboxylate transporter substrate binding protein n=1 Tax=Acidovorax sp. TaxID=1872122 RepID=UPI0025B8D063|nr:tripartite tricarboxylate transporter substrate binding protein [Acidovorax sp.]MCE1190861.1 tripartite tricarboxylate transporter substrate binding protein [Acidovorax sp.]